MPRTFKAVVAICDLNKAVKEAKDPKRITTNYTEHCLHAQFAMRVMGLDKVAGSTWNSVALTDDSKIDDSYNFKTKGIGDLVREFDRDEIAFVRSQLPREVEVTVND